MKLVPFLFYVLLFSFCLGQFGRLPGFSGEVRVYLWDLAAALLVLVWLVEKLGVSRELHFDQRIGLPLLLFSLFSLLSLLNGWRWVGVGEWLVAAGYWVRWVVYAGVYFVVYDLTSRDEDWAKHATNWLIWSGVILAVLGFVQLAIFPNLTELDPRLGWDPHQNRLFATWLDPNFLGAYFVLSMALVLGRFFADPKDRLLDILDLGILGLALFLTFSRSAWGMLAVVIGVFGLLKSPKLLFLMLLLFGGAYFLVPRVQTRLAGVTDPADSAHFRYLSWNHAVAVIRKYPWLGVGFNAFRYVQEREGLFRDERGVDQPSAHAGAGSDSSLLLVWATTGIFGLISYFWLYGSLLWHSLTNYLRKFRGQSARSRFLALAFFAGLVGLLAESSFINSLFYPPILIWLWIVAGLVLAEGWEKRWR